MLEKIESGFDFRPAELMGVLQSALNGRFSGISMPRNEVPGRFHKLNRYFKGVGDPYATTELDEITVRQTFLPQPYCSVRVARDRDEQTIWDLQVERTAQAVDLRLTGQG